MQFPRRITLLKLKVEGLHWQGEVVCDEVKYSIGNRGGGGGGRGVFTEKVCGSSK